MQKLSTFQFWLELSLTIQCIAEELAVRNGQFAKAVQDENWKEFSSRQIELAMMKNNITKVWARIRVKPLQNWTWEDGSICSDPTPNKAFKISDQLCGILWFERIDDHSCAKQLPYICSFSGGFMDDSTVVCTYVGKEKFCLFQEPCNYFEARYSCQDRGGRLATVTPSLSEDQLTSQLGDAFKDTYRAWVGTRKIDIVYLNGTNVNNSLEWGPQEPDFHHFDFRLLVWKLAHQSLQLMTANCSEINLYFVVPDSVTFPSRPIQVIIPFCFVIIFVILFFIILGCMIKRDTGEEARRNEDTEM